MTDIQGIDECGIYRTPRPISYVSNSGNSHQHGDINQTEENTTQPYTQSTQRSRVTIKYRNNISTDCPTRERSQSVTTGRPTSTTEEDRSALGTLQFHGPVHQNYVTEQSRLKSFSSWPPALPQQPQELAEAGFFYTGRSDQVKCFYCDGGLESWEAADSPWGEHQKWFSDCAFVKMKRDSVKIISIQENKNPLTINGFKTKETTVEKETIETKVEKDKETTVEHQTIETKEEKQPKDSTKLEDLKKEVESLREERSCKICMENEASIVFLPCGHLCSCANCAPALKVRFKHQTNP